MLISVTKRVTSKLVQLLTASNGMNASIAALAQAEAAALASIPASHFITESIASDIAEKSGEVKYTAVYIYCDKIVNALTEKFRSFSGSIQMEIDVRVSQDRLEGTDRMSQLYAEAVTQTLNQSRGDWGQGLFYSGAYEVSFGPIKHGGRNFIKSAKISFHVDASVD